MTTSNDKTLSLEHNEVERRAVVLVNTHSRRGQELYETALTRLNDLGVIVEKSVACDRQATMLAETKAAIERKIPIVVAGGGDGTINSLASSIMDGDSVLGVLPFGTGNAFARDLNITSDVEKACQTIAKGKVSAVDVGIANERLFLNVATVGLTTRIATELHESLKRKFGWFVYLYAAIKALDQIKPFRATLETENGKHTFETLEIVIGNGRYHAGPFPISPDAGIETGHFSIYALESATKAAILRLAVHLPSGTHVKLPDVHSESAKSGKLTSSPAVKSTLDGEQGPATPINFEVRAAALRVLTPDDFGG